MVYDFIFISNSFLLESKGFLIVGGDSRKKKGTRFNKIGGEKMKSELGNEVSRRIQSKKKS